MDLEDIAKLVEMFKRSRVEEDDKVIIDSEMVRSGLDRMEMCLLAKVFSSRPIPRDIFKQQMPKILQTSKSVEVEAVRENLFVLEFRSAIDRRRTLLEGPWNIFRNLVVFHEIKGLQNLLEIPFEHVDIWVQLYNLPFAFMNRRVLESIGAKVGVVLEVDEGDGGNYWGQYARIRARIDLSKPLKKCVTVKVEGEAEEEIVIVLIYERLPDFCYGCGRMGHTMKECRSKDLVDDDRENPPYGPWLKAATSQGDGDPAEIEEKMEVRKEKKGDRISALQQLVAPFGKTDTVSVLSEAMGYIRFLHAQIEALSSPYMRNAPANSVQERNCLYPEEAAATGQDTVNNLRSRGLCLVPISCTEKVGNDNGADYWGPAALGGGWVLIDLQAHDGD